MAETDNSDKPRSGTDRANCMQLGFSSDQVEDVVVGDGGGVMILLNESGQEHLDQVQEMREMHR